MTPVLYSFRRCPYAMRARLAIAASGVRVELREILLRDKPAHLLKISPKGTVPVLQLENSVLEESRDIMDWALAQNDPGKWLEMPPEGEHWIKAIEGPFKAALDRYKYANRYDGVDPIEQRNIASDILQEVEPNLAKNPWIYGKNPSLADMATITFVRQFANVDRVWFDSQNWPGIKKWLSEFLASEEFSAIMLKYPQWKVGEEPTYFGASLNRM